MKIELKKGLVDSIRFIAESDEDRKILKSLSYCEHVVWDHMTYGENFVELSGSEPLDEPDTDEVSQLD